MSELEKRKDFGVACAIRAGDLVRTYMRPEMQVDRKADRSPVTEADRAAERLVRAELARQFPADGCLGEEYGASPGQNAYQWVVDPIDGTKSFIAGVPLFGTLLALLRDGQPVLGVIYLPMLRECLFAWEGGGAWHGTPGQTPAPARVSETPALADSLFVTTEVASFADQGQLAVYHELEKRCWITRTWGDCYGYYLVATGRATLMIDPILNLWDAAPMLTILHEAGGKYTDWQGRASVAHPTAVASNGHVHDQVLAILQSPQFTPSAARIPRAMP